MRDIYDVLNGDLNIGENEASKSANILQTQIGTLEYAPDFGIDLEFFLDPNFTYQNESFKSYLVQRLSEHHVNVNRVIEQIESLFEKYTFEVGQSDSGDGLIS